MKHILLIVTLFFSILGVSQTLKPVNWETSYKEISATEGEIIFTAVIDKKWHIYSQRPTDVGPIPTSFTIAPSSNIELLGKTQEEDAHEEYVAAFDAKVFVFEGTAVFKQKIKRKNAKAFSINTTLEFMTCNDKQCLPPSTLEFTINVNEAKK